MPNISTLNDIKIGLTINFRGEPYLVISAKFVRMQAQKPVVQSKLRNLTSGKVLEHTFNTGEDVEIADISRRKVQYLYREGDVFHFMDNESYEQFSLPQEVLGDKSKFLKEGSEVSAMYFNDQPINFDLPVKMDFAVTEAPEGAKGDTAQGKVTKPATIETGMTVNVPMFIKAGDTIRVNTETGDYVQRV